MNFLSYAVRDILRTKSISVFFVLNLALGLLGFVLIESFRNAVDQRMAQNSQEVLGADLSVSGRRELQPQEEKALQEIVQGWPQAQQVELYSMISLDSASRLVQIKTLPEGFPFYGKFKIQTGTAVAELTGSDLQTGQIWIYPELRDQIGLTLGQTVKMGEGSFVVSGFVEDDVGSVWGAFSLAPRVFIRSQDLSKTKLLTEGSLASYYRLIKTPSGIDSNEVANQLSKVLSDPGLRVLSHRRAAEQAGRFLQYFADYLGLVAVVGLLLSALGLSYLARMFIQSKLKEMAILLSLGMRTGAVLSTVLFQLILLGFVSALLVLIFAVPLLDFVESWVFKVVQMQLDLRLGSTVVLGSVLLATIGLVLILLPEIQRLRFVQPLVLFREYAQSQLESQISFLWRLPALAVLCLLSVYQAHSLKIGLGFGLGIILIAGVVVVLARMALKALSRVGVKGMGLRYALRSLARGGIGTITSLLALSLGTAILVLMPQIRSSLTSEIKRPPTGDLPSLFLFDVQPEQVKGLQEFAAKQGFELQTVSPLVRSRLESINGQPFEKSNVNENRFFREEEQADRTRNRTYNLTYRSKLSPSEQIVAGEYVGTWSTSEVPPISVEERFAERLGVKMGDVLAFDVQGVEVFGKVSSLRRVRWTSFQPNFFVQFPDGVLNEAPQVYLASVPPLTDAAKAAFQLGVVRQFQNVSMIDVDRTLEKLLSVVDLISLVLNAMAVLSILVGFFVLASILADQLSRRERDVVLLKLLGADFSVIRKTLILEYWILSLSGGLVGAMFGVGAAWTLTRFVFDGVWAPDWIAAASVVLALFAISDLITRVLVYRTLARTRVSSL